MSLSMFSKTSWNRMLSLDLPWVFASLEMRMLRLFWRFRASLVVSG